MRSLLLIFLLFTGIADAVAFPHGGTTSPVTPLNYNQPVAARFLPPSSDDNNSGFGANTWGQSRMAFTAHGQLNNFQVDAFGFQLFVNATPDAGLISYQARGKLEYPAGTFYNFTWSGNAQKTVNGANSSRSDILTLATNIPDGANYWINWEITGTAFVMAVSNRSLSGESYGFGTGTPPTLGTSYSGSSARTPIVAPNMVTAAQQTPATFNMFIGDSNMVDQSHNYDASGVAAFPAAIDSTTSAMKFSMSGNDLYVVAPNFSHRAAIMDVYVPHHVFVLLGTNDLVAGSPNNTAAVMEANADSIAASIVAHGGIPHFFTLPPRIVSGTLQNEATRIAYNAYIRSASGTGNYGVYYELANLVETAQDSGVWKTSYSADGGLHVNWSNASIKTIVLNDFASYYAGL